VRIIFLKRVFVCDAVWLHFAPARRNAIPMLLIVSPFGQLSSSLRELFFFLCHVLFSLYGVWLLCVIPGA
jgi:hypothetical protein